MSTNAGEVANDAAIALGKGVEAQGIHSIVIGDSAKVGKTSSSYSIAVGYKADATGDGATAIGPAVRKQTTDESGEVVLVEYGATASGTYAIALGAAAQATADNSIAIGHEAKTSGNGGAIAIGRWANVSGEGSIGIGNDLSVSGSDAVAVGVGSHADGENSTALGAFAHAWKEGATAVGAASAYGEKSTALGYGSYAKANYSVALGNDSVADREAGSVGYLSPQEDYSAEDSAKPEVAAWKANLGAVSVGAKLEEGGQTYQGTRQITNVAAGSDLTDAVNVAQLKVVNEAAKAAKTVINQGDNVTITSTTDAEDGHTIYTINATDTKYTAGNGISIDSNNNNAISVKLKNGEKNLVVDASGLSLNQNLNVTSVNAGGTVINNGGLSIGGNTYVSSSGLNASGQKITNVANGTDDSDAVNYGQLKAIEEAAGKGWNVSTNGGTATKVAPGDTVDFAGDNNISVSNEGKNVKVALKNDISVNKITTNNAYVTNVDASNNSSVTNVEYVNKQIAGSALSAGNGIDITDKVVSVKLKEGEKNLVVDASGLSLNQEISVNKITTNNAYVTNVDETNQDGQMVYKVNLNSDILLKDLTSETGKYVSISGTNGTIETTGSITTKDRVYAENGGKLANIDVTGNTISNGSSSITMDGSNVKVNDKVTIDQTGKISGVADGDISKNSTDAVNGSQLNDTNNRVTKVEGDITKINTEITNIKGDITEIKGNITTINNKLDEHTTQINQNTQNITNLDNRVTEVEKTAGKHSSVSTEDSNVIIDDTGKNAAGGTDYKISLNKNQVLDSVKTGDTVMNNDGIKVGDKVSVTKDAVTAGSTSISNDGLKIGDKTYVNSDGLNANSQKVTNVADGEISATSKDAVNGSQLHAASEQIIDNSNRISRLGNRINKVGAGAAALAALHPMDFDPDDKWSFAAGYGNYAGENAAAIGAYYRPDEKVMFSVGGTVGNGENMVNAGISFALDRTNHVSNSRTALAREVIDLRSQLVEMGAKMAKMEAMLGVIDESKTKLFPDVPANHWAYEYIAKLAGNGILEGYSDGTFGGDRLMTRYEFATMLYRAIEKGAALEERIINEFAPELGRIRVDRISGKDSDRNKIERVRVNGPRSERDHYGSKLK